MKKIVNSFNMDMEDFSEVFNGTAEAIDDIDLFERNYYNTTENVVYIVDEFETGLASFEDCFHALYISFDDIEAYLNKLNDEKLSSIGTYLAMVQDDLIEIEEVLYDKLNELKTFKSKLVKYIIEEEKKRKNFEIAQELELFKN